MDVIDCRDPHSARVATRLPESEWPADAWLRPPRIRTKRVKAALLAIRRVPLLGAGFCPRGSPENMCLYPRFDYFNAEGC